MQFILKITVDNDAFAGDQENPFGDSTHTEVARILHKLADRIEETPRATERDQDDPFVLMDYNGASVGLAYFTEVDDD